MHLIPPPSHNRMRLSPQVGLRSGLMIRAEKPMETVLKKLPGVNDHALKSGQLALSVYLKLVNPLALGTAFGGSVFRLWSWPLTLMGVGASYVGALGARHLASDLMEQAEHYREHPQTPTPKFFTHTGTQLMMKALNADFSGLLVDPTQYAAIGDKTKYEHFLTLLNQIGAHFTGLYKPRHPPTFTSKIQGDASSRQLSHAAQLTLEQYLRNTATWSNNASHRAAHTAPLMSIGHEQDGLPLLARMLNSITKHRGVRWFTTTPLMAMIPKVKPESHSPITPAPIWVAEVPIIGGPLAEKVSAFAKVRNLYFRTDPHKDLEDTRLTHWSSFTHHVKQMNSIIDAHADAKTPRLKLDDAHFREFLHAKSRHEKQLAVRLFFYKLGFAFHLKRPGSLADLMKRWHDVDAAAMRSMFDVAQCGNFKQGMQFLISNTVNEGWERIANGGFSAIMEFGVAQIPPPFYGPARAISSLIELAFDIERKPIKRQGFTYNPIMNKRNN
jgi:hypothetical protein